MAQVLVEGRCTAEHSLHLINVGLSRKGIRIWFLILDLTQVFPYIHNLGSIKIKSLVEDRCVAKHVFHLIKS